MAIASASSSAATRPPRAAMASLRITPQGVRMTNTLPRYREIAPSFFQWPQRWSLEMAARSGLSAPDAPLWELDDPRSVARDWIGYCPAQIGPLEKSRRLSFVSCSRLGSGQAPPPAHQRRSEATSTP